LQKRTSLQVTLPLADISRQKALHPPEHLPSTSVTQSFVTLPIILHLSKKSKCFCKLFFYNFQFNEHLLF